MAEHSSPPANAVTGKDVRPQAQLQEFVLDPKMPRRLIDRPATLYLADIGPIA
jgi:hypothetical protein